MNCPQCNYVVPQGQALCPNCGLSLSQTIGNAATGQPPVPPIGVQASPQVNAVSSAPPTLSQQPVVPPQQPAAPQQSVAPQIPLQTSPAVVQPTEAAQNLPQQAPTAPPQPSQPIVTPGVQPAAPVYAPPQAASQPQEQFATNPTTPMTQVMAPQESQTYTPSQPAPQYPSQQVYPETSTVTSQAGFQQAQDYQTSNDYGAGGFSPAVQFSGAPPAPKKSKKKLIIGITSGVVALILVIVGIFVVMELMRSGTYNDAYALMDNASYQEAKVKFDELGDYRDSADMSKLCQQHIDYNSALDLMDSGDYEAAEKAFSALVPFQDSSDLAYECQNYISYYTAEDLLAAADYASAKSLFDELAYIGFLDSEDKSYQCSYALADLILSEGKNYEAYEAFMAISEYSDAYDRAQACLIARPGTGETYRNSDFGATTVDLTINSYGISEAYYIKIYSGDTVVSTVFLNPESTANISLPAGTYVIKAASGDMWFGETDLFGDYGYYYVMIFDSGEYMTLDSGYIYTLDLQVTEGGNINSRNEGRSDF